MNPPSEKGPQASVELAPGRTLLGVERPGESQRRFSNSLSPGEEYLKADSLAANGLRRRSPSPSPSSVGSVRLSPVPSTRQVPVSGPEPALPSDIEPQLSALQEFWLRNKGPILVASAQLFGALMNLSARLLEFEGEGMHPIGVLLIRQSITATCSFLYMWWKQVPDQPWGSKDIRWLLVLRGFSGFFGIFGMWYSMMYLPLADATVITFLAPSVAGILCYFVLREPYTKIEQLSTLVALLGVVLIARPTAFFSNSPSEDPTTSPPPPDGGGASTPSFEDHATSQERLVAVGVALLGVLGGSGAFTTLRYLGKRAHPLISVNFFGIACVIICLSLLIAGPLLDIGQPKLRWVSPTTGKQWFLLLSIGLEGFAAQYLMTAGLAVDKSNRANSMVYTHMLFAASFDRWVFGHHMGLMSFAGCALILGSAIGVVFMKRKPSPKAEMVEDVERQRNAVGEAEASPMLVGVGGHGEDIQLERL